MNGWRIESLSLFIVPSESWRAVPREPGSREPSEARPTAKQNLKDRASRPHPRDLRNSRRRPHILFPDMQTLTPMLLTASALHADPRFQITKSTIDSGGARAVAGPRFTLTGTIGQPDAASGLVSANSRFALEPGFWSQYSVLQTTGHPELTMRPAQVRGSAVLAWSAAATGYILEQSPGLAAASWPPRRHRRAGHRNRAHRHRTHAGPRKFFRLRRP